MIKLLASPAFVLLSAVAGFSQDSGWPRQVAKVGNTYSYQPQVDEWKDFVELE